MFRDKSWRNATKIGASGRITGRNEYVEVYPYIDKFHYARCEEMSHSQNSDRDIEKSGITRFEKAVSLIERVFITICLSAILLFFIWRYIPISESYQMPALLGGIALVIVIIMIEILLAEKRDHPR
jgi:hypothetical protein